MDTNLEYLQRFGITKAEFDAIYQAQAQKVCAAERAQKARAEARKSARGQNVAVRSTVEESSESGWAPVADALRWMVSNNTCGLGAELITFSQLVPAFEAACREAGVSGAYSSRFRVARVAEQAGIRRLRNPIRLIPGCPHQTVVYAVRNHGRWRRASEIEIRQALNHAPVQIPA